MRGFPNGYDWYTRPSRTEQGEINVVTLRAGHRYHIRARLSGGTSVCLMQRHLPDDIECWTPSGQLSGARQMSLEHWEIQPVEHDREAELWFGFKHESTNERFELVTISEIPNRGATAGRPALEIWSWSA